MDDSKKVHFSKSPILKNFLWKFHGSVLGLVGLIDAKGIDLSQPIWLWGCPTEGLKQGKNSFLVFFSHFWAYVGQPHDHIGWAKSMPFASINPTNPRTHPAQFGKKILRIGGYGKWPFFESAILIFFFQKKNFFFASFLWKLVNIYRITRIFWNFDDYPDF